MMTLRTLRRRTTIAIVTLSLVSIVVVSSCNSAQIGLRITASTVLTTGTDEASSTTSTPALLSVGAAATDLHNVDWAQVPIPGEFCAISGLVHFTAGEATATSNSWGLVHLAVDPIVMYGDLDGDGRSEAAISVECDNGGGTADGQIGFAYIVFEDMHGRLSVIGTITAQRTGRGSHVTLIHLVEMKIGRVVVHEDWYRPSDATCCPSGTATTIWTLDDGHLTHGAPDITS